jgi:hypothetical protein
VTLLRLGNSRRRVRNAVEDYRKSFGMLGKARRINAKHKKLRRNSALLEKACRRRFAGAPDCVAALKEGSVYQLEPMFLYRRGDGGGRDGRGTGNDSSGGSRRSNSNGTDGASVSRAGYMDQLSSSSSSASSQDDVPASPATLWHRELGKAEDALRRFEAAATADLDGNSEISSEEAAVARAAEIGVVDFVNVQVAENSILGLVLLHLSRAAAMIKKDAEGMVMMGGGGMDMDMGADTIAATAASSAATQANIGAAYLALSLSIVTTYGVDDERDHDRDTCTFVSKLIDEASDALDTAARILSSPPLARQEHFSKLLTSAIRANTGVAGHVRQRVQQILESFRGDVPTLPNTSSQSSSSSSSSSSSYSSSNDGLDPSDKNDTKPLSVTPRRRQTYPPIDRITWPPDKEALAKVGITEPRAGLSIGDFLRRCHRPILIQGTTEEDIEAWRLRTKWSNMTYLEAQLSPKMHIDLSDEPENLYATSKSSKLIHTAEFVSRLVYMNATGGRPHDGKHPYISVNIDDIPEGPLHDDLNGVEFQSVSTGVSILGDSMKLLLWIGASNVSAIAHYDHAFNTFMMLKGSKRFIVAPPRDTAGMYLHPAPTHSHRQSQLNNLDNIDFVAYPKARLVEFSEATLGPGDLIFLPPFWYHSVESVVGPSVAIRWVSVLVLFVYRARTKLRLANSSFLSFFFF